MCSCNLGEAAVNGEEEAHPSQVSVKTFKELFILRKWSR